MSPYCQKEIEEKKSIMCLCFKKEKKATHRVFREQVSVAP